MVGATKSKRMHARNAAAVAAVGALAVGIVSIPAAPAHAADTITATDQAYFGYYGLDRARAKGYTGKGVTIAMIDGRVDTSVPESVHDHCSVEYGKSRNRCCINPRRARLRCRTGCSASYLSDEPRERCGGK